MSEIKSTDDLISSLCEDCEPLKPMTHPALRMIPWVGISTFYTVLMIAVVGARFDWQEQIYAPEFLFEISMAAFISISACFAVGWLSIPDMRGKPWIKFIPLVLLGILGLWACYRTMNEGMGMPDMDLKHCFSNAFLFSFIPVVLISYLATRGATTKPGWMCFMVILAVSSAGWIAQRFTCGIDDIGHAYLYHFIPYVTFGAVFATLGQKLFRW